MAELLPGEIISADALQAYRGFDLGTAKPSPDEQERVRHHLIDIRQPDESYSAGEFARLAKACLADIRGRNRRPIVVGGSGLYLRALLDGISPIPPTSPEVHDELRKEGRRVRSSMRRSAQAPEVHGRQPRSQSGKVSRRVVQSHMQRIVREQEEKT